VANIRVHEQPFSGQGVVSYMWMDRCTLSF